VSDARPKPRASGPGSKPGVPCSRPPSKPASTAGAVDDGADDLSSGDDRGTPPPPSPLQPPGLSPAAHAALAGRTSPAPLGSASVAASLLGGAAAPKRPGDGRSYPRPTTAAAGVSAPGLAPPRPAFSFHPQHADPSLPAVPLAPDPALVLTRLMAYRCAGLARRL
jgi:hypothetical protein